ncbi:nickel ABC transporter permease [Desulfoscipio sp. XC116]|uniref:nickel ABC transporter permease n=1 Tax=Desulfoscipio sp. XC116 TaxID=3144975 RepID=UPI00325A9301
MLKYIVKRLAMLIIVTMGVTLITFSMMHWAPGDPAELMAISRYGLESVNEQNIARIRVEEGLDAPIFVQYWHWLEHTWRGDLGRSIVTGDLVLDEIRLKIPATFELALAALIISLIIALPAGIISAVKQYSPVDYLTMTGALLGVSIPNFWLGLLLILLFSVTLGWLPVFGYGTFKHMVLPAVTLGAGMAAITTRLIRSSMLGVLRQDYIITARSKGLSEGSIIHNHALKNSLIPVITVIGLQIGHLLEGAVIVEVIFAWPGIGKLLVDSIFARDFFMIQGCVLLFAVIFVIVNLLVDISYIYLDPRIRHKKEY